MRVFGFARDAHGAWFGVIACVAIALQMAFPQDGRFHFFPFACASPVAAHVLSRGRIPFWMLGAWFLFSCNYAFRTWVSGAAEVTLPAFAFHLVLFVGWVHFWFYIGLARSASTKAVEPTGSATIRR